MATSNRAVDAPYRDRDTQDGPGLQPQKPVSEVDVEECPSGTVLTIATRNSSYRLTLRDPAERMTLIQGGRFFAEPKPGRIEGSLDDGGVLHSGRIQVGERLQLFGEVPITTSKVASIVVEG